MPKKEAPDLGRLKDLLSYDGEIGIFVWARTRNKAPKGKRAGTVRPDGYRQIMVDAKCYFEHMLAWYFATGIWPKNDVDHKNMVRNDNRLSNLREATRSQSNFNKNVRKDSLTGIKGVRWCTQKSKWEAHAGLSGQRIHIGFYDSKEEAKRVRDEFAMPIHKEYFRT